VVEKDSIRIWEAGGVTLFGGRRRGAVSACVVGAVVCALFVAGMGAAGAQVPSSDEASVDDGQLREDLIADQESLLNSYRCLFDIDTEVVPGGCVEGRPAQGRIEPRSFEGTPSQQDIRGRDQLIETQESLLNAYRCLFSVDTQIVPGGCPSGEPTRATPESGQEAAPIGTVTPQESSSPPEVQVSFASASYTAAEGTTAQITVQLDTASRRTVVVPLSAAFYGGAAAADFGTLPTSVTFAAEETSKTLEIEVFGDFLRDPGESVVLAIGSALPNGVTQGTPSQTTITITDTDPPDFVVSFVSATYTAAEGTTVNVTIKLDAPSENFIGFGFTVSYQGGATDADVGHIPTLPEGVVFEPNETTKTVPLYIESDLVADPGESVVLSLYPGGVSGEGVSPGEIRGAVGSLGRTTITIVDDWPPEVVMSFASASYTAEEGTTAQITVQLNTAAGRTVAIPLTTALRGGATAADTGTLPTTVTFGPTDTTKTIDIEITDDSHSDPGESITLAVGQNLPDGVTQSGPSQTTINITDNNTPTVNVSFALASYSAEEGATAQVTVELDTVPFRTLTIPLAYTFKGGATAADTGTLPSTVTFGPTDTTKTITFTINDDTDAETGERVEITFGTPLPADVTQGTLSQTTVSFTDAAPPQVQVSFASGSYTADEGTTAQVTVELDTAPGRTLVIPLTWELQGGARYPDVGKTPGNVTFSAHETTKTVTFDILSDNLIDPGESIKVSFGRTLPDGVTQGGPSESTIYFTDTSTVNVRFASASYTAEEGTTAQITVQLNTAAGRTVAIPLTTAFQGGATAADFVTLPTSVTFGPTDTAKTIDIEITDDSHSDPGESIKVSFGSTLPDGVTQGGPSQTTINITDNDFQQLQVELWGESTTAAEGTWAHVGVSLSATPNRILVIPFTVTFQGGATEDDISDLALTRDPVTGTLTAAFAVGERTKPITFDVLTDDLVESGESVTISIGSSLPEGVILGTPSQFTITLTDAAEPEA